MGKNVSKIENEKQKINISKIGNKKQKVNVSKIRSNLELEQLC